MGGSPGIVYVSLTVICDSGSTVGMGRATGRATAIKCVSSMLVQAWQRVRLDPPPSRLEDDTGPTATKAPTLKRPMFLL
ncbi:hypothetical protein AeRB84_015646 [Aphanomyces euteiches]|nr:hypothetical protein AeRB84_015646 [Aphanomyces euteiches]